MGKLVVTEFVSLDGVMQAPGGEDFKYPGWSFAFDRGEDGNQFKLDETLETDALLIGRVTYESFAGAWPDYEGPFADRMNAMRKVVVSNTLTDPEWTNTRVLSGDLVAGITELKSGDGGPIQVPGSATLVHGLLDAGLVDELRLMVFPLSIGAGLRVFPETQKKQTWALTATESFPSGVRVDTYHPA